MAVYYRRRFEAVADGGTRTSTRWPHLVVSYCICKQLSGDLRVCHCVPLARGLISSRLETGCGSMHCSTSALYSKLARLGLDVMARRLDIALDVETRRLDATEHCHRLDAHGSLDVKP